MHRDHARPLLKTVQKAIEEITVLAVLVANMQRGSDEYIKFLDGTTNIINKYDLNYHDPKWDKS